MCGHSLSHGVFPYKLLGVQQGEFLISLKPSSVLKVFIHSRRPGYSLRMHLTLYFLHLFIPF